MGYLSVLPAVNHRTEAIFILFLFFFYFSFFIYVEHFCAEKKSKSNSKKTSLHRGPKLSTDDEVDYCNLRFGDYNFRWRSKRRSRNREVHGRNEHKIGRPYETTLPAK